MSSRSSVDRAPARCSGGHGFDSCRGLRFFFVPRSCHVEYFIFNILTHFLKSLKDFSPPFPLKERKSTVFKFVQIAVVNFHACHRLSASLLNVICHLSNAVLQYQASIAGLS